MAFRKSISVSHSFAGIGSRTRISRVAFIVSVLSAFSLAAAPSARKVTIGENGKLEGALNGWAWVAPGQQTTVTFPSPCNEKGCFKNTGGKLCTKGHINALTCTNPGTPQVSCNWDKNWGVVLGMNPGPFGMAQTGIPFGDVSVVRDFLGLEGQVGKPEREHPKRKVDGMACARSEVSGVRSSCATSAMSRRRCSSLVSSRPAISLNEAIRPRNSGVPWGATRTE